MGDTVVERPPREWKVLGSSQGVGSLQIKMVVHVTDSFLGAQEISLSRTTESSGQYRMIGRAPVLFPKVYLIQY